MASVFGFTVGGVGLAEGLAGLVPCGAGQPEIVEQLLLLWGKGWHVGSGVSNPLTLAYWFRFRIPYDAEIFTFRSVPSSNQQAWWLDVIGREPLLTPAEELELGRMIRLHQDHPEPCPPGIRRRGLRARDRFVRANLRLVVSYVSKRCHRLTRIHGTEDLIQAGNLGLIQAVDKFDPARGYRFSTYGYWWIMQSINKWIDQNGRSIAIPGSHSQYLGKIGPATRRLEGELGRLPTPAEIAEALGCSETVLAQVVENGRAVGSLDQVVGDGDLDLGAMVASYDRTPEEDEEQAERWKQAEQLRNLIGRLPAHHQRLLSLAWGLDGVEVPRPELAQQEGLSTRRLDAKLNRLQAQLATQSVQLVLVAVSRVNRSPRLKRQRGRRPNAAEQLALI
jgi:RNA polymerase primary sigma factor